MLEKAAFIALPILTTIGIIRLYLDYVWGHCRSTSSLTGKTFIVTGANSGIGYETTKALVKRNARVILACRDVNKANAAIEKIRTHTCQGELITMHLDLASLESVCIFVTEVRNKYSKIDVLINNAAVFYPLALDTKTSDGFEIHFGVNHLGHFLLTKLMLQLLENAAPSRVVIVSSALSQKGTINFDDLNMTKVIATIKNSSGKDRRKLLKSHCGYNNSKLMNVHFGRALADRTKDRGIDVFLVSPGFTYSNLFRNVLSWHHYLIMAPFMLFYMRSSKQGAQTVLHCATEASLEGNTGVFFRNCAPFRAKIQHNKEIERRLWEASENSIIANMPQLFS